MRGGRRAKSEPYEAPYKGGLLWLLGGILAAQTVMLLAAAMVRHGSGWIRSCDFCGKEEKTGRPPWGLLRLSKNPGFQCAKAGALLQFGR